MQVQRNLTFRTNLLDEIGQVVDISLQQRMVTTQLLVSEWYSWIGDV